MMRKLQSLLTGVAYHELPPEELVVMAGADGPRIVQLSEELRDGLAEAQVSRLQEVAEQWVRTEEFWEQPPTTEVLPFLEEMTALARRAAGRPAPVLLDLPVAGRAARPAKVGETDERKPRPR